MESFFVDFATTFYTENLSGQWQDFHFLRPTWLWLCLPGILLPLLLAIKSQHDSDWGKAISPHLLKFLSTNALSGKKRASTILLGAIIVLVSLAQAGPSWNQMERPVQKLKDDLVIVLDLSLSMYATDLAPNRITRTRQKVLDILETRTEGQTGLVVYSKGAHVVTPLTDDVKTIESMLPALDPFIMPAAGSEPAVGVLAAVDLLKQAGVAKGKILLITDGIAPYQIEEIVSAADNVPFSLLSVGTQAGAPIDLPDRGYLKNGDTVVIAGNDFSLLHKLASELGTDVVQMSLTDEDIQQLNLLSNHPSNMKFEETEGESQTMSDWQDRGYLLIIPVLLLVLFAYRQGILSIVLIPLLIQIQSPPVEAALWDDLWSTDDQQAMKAFESGNPQIAAEKFDNKQWKATAQFQAQQYQQSADSFTEVVEGLTDNIDKANAYFNQGTALAKAQQFDKAITAFDEALKLNPEHAAAKKNKTIVEDIQEKLEEQEKQQSSENSENNQDNQQDKEDSEGQDSEQSGSEKKDSDKSDSENQDAEQSDSQQSKSQQSDSQQSDSDSEQAEQQDSQPGEEKQEEQSHQNEPGEKEGVPQPAQEEPQDEDAEGKQSEPASAIETPDPLKDEEQQAFEQWMRRVPDDPSGLLRRKFAQQYQQRDDKEQNENRPIW